MSEQTPIQKNLKCEHLEENPKHELYYFWPDGSEAGYMCAECARSSCFCFCCGGFFGGTDFDEHMVYTKGVCSSCWDELTESFDPEFDE